MSGADPAQVLMGRGGVEGGPTGSRTGTYVRGGGLTGGPTRSVFLHVNCHCLSC